MNDCIFCKIVNNELPSEVLFENKLVRIIKDIKPKAPIHLLVVSKKHLNSVKDLQDSDSGLIAQMILCAQKVAQDQNLKGYKLIFNVGREGGQIIDHLHLHLLGGWSSETHHVDV